MPGTQQTQQNPQDTLSMVMQLRQQGYSNDQIVQTLQQQGVNSTEILDALNQADLAGQQYGQQYYDQPVVDPQSFGRQSERIEEVAEAIINEKWNELVKDINKIAEWKEQAENRLTRMEQEIVNIKQNFQNLHRGVLGKVQQYDQNIQNVGAEIKAMEKVFQDILPKFTENVNRMSRLSKEKKD